MRMLRWMCGKTISDRIRNDNTSESWGGGTYCRKYGGKWAIRWVGHAERRQFCVKESRSVDY